MFANLNPGQDRPAGIATSVAPSRTQRPSRCDLDGRMARCYRRYATEVVSLPVEDVRFLDEYAREQGLGSRSAALHRAVRILRAAELGADYEGAWDEWVAGEDAAAWDQTSGDGLPR